MFVCVCRVLEGDCEIEICLLGYFRVSRQIGHQEGFSATTTTLEYTELAR
jgi:hypothetical protein